MPKEYIEREVISEGIRKYYYKNPPNSSYQEGFDHGLDKAQRVILDAPAADVVEVRHGRWVSVQHKLARVCSVCNRDEPYKFADVDADVYNYCPNCGAKMDLQEEYNDKARIYS